MNKQHGFKWFILGLAILAGLGARVSSAATYTLECEATKQGRITAQLSSFRFEISAPANPQTGQRTGQAHYELIVHLPVQRAYAAFLQATETNELMRTCKLTELEGGGGMVRLGAGGARPVDTLEWTFQDVTMLNAIALGSDGSGTNAGGAPQGSLQLTLNFRSYNLAARP